MCVGLLVSLTILESESNVRSVGNFAMVLMGDNGWRLRCVVPVIALVTLQVQVCTGTAITKIPNLAGW